MMPKLPVRNDLEFYCSEKRASTYHSYANEAVYEFRFYIKEPKEQGFCFGSESFASALEKRLNELRTFYKPAPVSEVDGEVNGRKVKIFRWVTDRDQATRWVFIDGYSNYWVELAINYRLDSKPEINTFLNSLGGYTLSGTEVLLGSLSTLGDRSPAVKTGVLSGNSLVKEAALKMSTPKPTYTDAARANNIEGSVMLNITYLANGGIGEIFVLKPLSHGLTEQAIAAARRIAFLPARENGVPVTIVGKFEYVFSIL